MGLFLRGCFTGDSQEGKRPMKAFEETAINQKNPRVRKIRVRNSGAGNGLCQFYGRLEECVLSAGKTMSIKFLVLGGGYFGFGGGGGKCRFYFYGRGDVSE